MGDNVIIFAPSHVIQGMPGAGKALEPGNIINHGREFEGDEAHGGGGEGGDDDKNSGGHGASHCRGGFQLTDDLRRS